ncbi:MAG: tetratricopeptide repeat protein [Bacteroidota bacterium]
MKHLILSICGILLISTLGFAQKSAGDLYNKGLVHEELGEFDMALSSYQQAAAKRARLKDVQYKIELLELADGKDRERDMDEIIDMRSQAEGVDPFFQLHLGRVYDARWEFQKALNTWDGYLNSAYDLSSSQVEVVQKLMVQTKRKIAAFNKPDDYEIQQLKAPINSPYAELSPTYFEAKHELLFASNRGSSDDADYYIYHAEGDEGTWAEPSRLGILGVFERNNANIEVVDEDGKLFMFNNNKGGDLFYSETRNGNWLLPVEFDSKISNTHLESHFFINEHEDRIIFASDKENKDKGLDLYQSFKDPKTGNWTKPRPFAEVINSDMDEDSPYLTHDEHTLYFSSDGHGSIGGYDIFKSELDSITLTWSEPVNMGFPINSPDDEIHFKINAGGKSGYFSSNRLHSMGDFDIYFYFEIKKVKIEGKVFDKEAKQRLSDVEVIFTPSSYEEEKFRSTTDTRGYYSAEIISTETYHIEIKRGEELLYEDRLQITKDFGEVSSLLIKDFILN